MNQNEFLNAVQPFKDKLFRIAKRLLVSTEEAEDTTQEVLVKLWTKKENLYVYNSLEAFSITMIKNYCLDQLKSKRAQNISIKNNNFVDKQPGLYQVLEDNDSLQWVEKIINQLPMQQKLIVQLRDIEQIEFSEIAIILEMNETAVRVAKTHNYGII
jgi:RNA polymerase sigma-70 factor (ECF subfamily)